jgi:protein-disulfide isomerase
VLVSLFKSLSHRKSTVMKFPIMFLSLMFAFLQPAQAAWQDAEALALVRSELAEWEARFVKAVVNPEVQLVRIDGIKVVPALSSETTDPIVVENTTIVRPLKEARKPKPGEPVFKRSRNFVRYLAKVEYSHQQLQAARQKYEAALKTVLASDKDFKDLEYRKVPGLDDAENAWQNVLNEVGSDAVREASAAYVGQEASLKGLTD